jgi:outer membrane protein assembly factor BamB
MLAFYFVLLARCTSATTTAPWPVIGYDLAYTSHGHGLGPRNASVSFLRTLADDGWAQMASVIFGNYNNVITASFNGTVSSFDLSTGLVQWTFALDAGAGASPSIAAGSILIIIDFMGTVYRLNEATGALEWRVSGANARVYCPAVVSGGRIFFGDTGGVLHALDLADGATLWKWSACGELPPSSPCSYNFLWRPALAMADGVTPCPDDDAGGCDTLFFAPDASGAPIGNIFALAAATGSVRWESLGWVSASGSPVFSAVIVARGRVIFGDGLRISALSASSGVSLFNVTPGGFYRRQSAYTPIASRHADALFVSIPNFGLFRLDAATGATVWTSGITVTPAGGALDSKGTILFVTDVSSVIRAINTSSGDQLWEYPTDCSQMTNLALGPNKTLAVSANTNTGATVLIVIGESLSPPQAPSSSGSSTPSLNALAIGMVVVCAVIVLIFISIRCWQWRPISKVAAVATRDPVLRAEMGTSTGDLHMHLLSDTSTSTSDTDVQCDTLLNSVVIFANTRELPGAAGSAGGNYRSIIISNELPDSIDGDSYVLSGTALTDKSIN